MDDDLFRRMDDYWTQRAPGSAEKTDALLGEGLMYRALLDQMLAGVVGKKALDMATGTGLMAIELARMGYEVTAIDSNEAMLNEASKLAEKYGVDVDFVKGDVQNPVIRRETYDVIVCKDGLWALQDPSAAYSRWRDILKPEGRIVIIDTNYYLYLTDPHYMERREFVMGQERERDNTYLELFENTKVDASICEGFAKELTLTKIFRPAWDIGELMKLGFSNIKVHCLDRVHFHPEGPHGHIETPMTFILSAVKTHSIYEWSIEFATHEINMMDLKKETETALNMVGPNLRCLSNDDCVRLLIAMNASDLTVTQAAELLGVSHSLASYDLRLLKENNFVDNVKKGRESVYFLRDKGIVNRLLSCAMMVNVDRYDNI